MPHSQHSAAPGSPAIVGPEDRVVRAIASSLSSGASGPTPWKEQAHLELPLLPTPDRPRRRGCPDCPARQDHPGRPWPGGHDAPACGPGAPLSTRGPGRWTRTHKAPPAGKQGAAAATHATRLLRALRLRYPCWLPCQVLFWRRGEPARGTAGQHRPAANLSGHLRLERALRNRARQPRDQYGHGDRFRPWARAPTVIAN